MRKQAVIMQSNTSGWAYLGRFVSGRAMDGRHRTDRDFFRPATKSLHAHVQKPSKWSSMPGWKVAAWRLGSVAIALFFLYVRVHYGSGILHVVLFVFGGIILIPPAILIYKRISDYRHIQSWVLPLHEALAAGPLSSMPSWGDHSYIKLPKGFHGNENAVLRIGLPKKFGAEPKSKELVRSCVEAKLAIYDPDMTWTTAGSKPYVSVKQAPKPPKKVALDDIKLAMRAANEDAPVLGIGIRNNIVAVSFATESPHLLMSMGTGGGKSNTTKSLACQILANGGIVIILDVKRVSHLGWAQGLPGVVYVRDIADIHRALIVAGEAGSRRFRLIEQYGEAIVSNLPRVLVVCEEWNATAPRLTQYWQDTRQSSDPKRSPALAAFGDGLFLGRAAKVNYLCIGQRATASVVGGSNLENFGARLLARYSQGTAKLLCPEVKFPPSSRIPGRSQLYLAGDLVETQIAFLTDEQARAWAIEGQQRLSITWPYWGADVTAITNVIDTLAEPITVTGPDPYPEYPALTTGPTPDAPSDFDSGPTPQPDPVRIGLTEACAAGGPLATYGMSVNAARQARYRDPDGFPHGTTDSGPELLYDPRELEIYARNRPRTPRERVTQ